MVKNGTNFAIQWVQKSKINNFETNNANDVSKVAIQVGIVDMKGK